MSDILFISGSPKRDRNNDRAVKRMIEIAKQEDFKFIEELYLSETETFPCIDCDRCKASHRCYEEKVNAVNEKLAKTRAIIISSPVYFGCVSAQLKALFDRTRPLRRANMALKNKVGAAVAIGGSRNGGQEMTLQAIHSWMHIHGMLVAGDNSHFGGTLTVPVMEDKVGLITLEETVRKVCEILKGYNPR